MMVVMVVVAVVTVVVVVVVRSLPPPAPRDYVAEKNFRDDFFKIKVLMKVLKMVLLHITYTYRH